jgi:hypothetical protein
VPKTSNDAAPKPQRGRPRDLERCKRILDAATRYFSAHGLERASLEAIAAEAGVIEDDHLQPLRIQGRALSGGGPAKD